MSIYRDKSNEELAKARRHLADLDCHPRSPAMLAIDAEMRRRIELARELVTGDVPEAPLRVDIVDYGRKP